MTVRQTNRARKLPLWRLGPCIVAVAVLGLLPAASYQIDALPTDAPRTDAPPTDAQPTDATSASPLSLDALDQRLRGDLSEKQRSAADLAAANQVIQTITPTDWLGPLAPLALSPFFGITCLSGLAIWEPSWMPRNGLLDASTPLKDPTLFWIFAALTVMTSLPRFSKVSKPLAQALDHVEAYAGIITLIVIRFMASPDEPLVESPEALQAGVVSTSVNALMCVALAINVLVINSVKFCFEFVIWLTPFPFLDGCFEIANKSVCGALMALYAFSPLLATLLNLLILALSFLMLRRFYRHLRFYRHFIVDWFLATISERYATPKKAELVVFAKEDSSYFRCRERLILRRTDDGWTLTQPRPLRAPIQLQIPAQSRLTLSRGWFLNTLKIEGPVPVSLIFTRRYHQRIAKLADLLGAKELTPDGAEARDGKFAKSNFA